jgi:hypothetical protein
MITGLQAAILCSRFEVGPGGNVDYFGVLGGGLVAHERPQLMRCCLCLHVFTSGAPCWAEAAVESPGFSTAIPFRAPEATDLAGVLLPLGIPVIQPGALVIRIRNTDPARGQDMHAKFPIAIARHAVASTLSDRQVRHQAEVLAHAAREALLRRDWLSGAPPKGS